MNFLPILVEAEWLSENELFANCVSEVSIVFLQSEMRKNTRHYWLPPTWIFAQRKYSSPGRILPDWEKNWERRQEFWTLSGMLAGPGDSRSDGRTEQTENRENRGEDRAEPDSQGLKEVWQ